MSRLFQAMLLGPLISMFSNKKVFIVALKPNKDLDYMNKQFEAGNIKPILDRDFQLEEIRDAFHLFQKGEHRGKVVITVLEC
jgi:NADPH:quinone reductase-like Zn-dependent oxidoreductase